MTPNLTSSAPISVPHKPWLHWAMVLLIAMIGYLAYVQVETWQQNRSRMEQKKDSGRHGKHSNQDARQRAEEEYQKAKEEFTNLDKKANKSKADRQAIDKLRKRVEHWRKKKDWGGENHSQKHKGN